MDFISNAIITKAEADTTLMALISVIRNLQIEEGVEMPYITFYIVNDIGLYTFSGNGEEAIVQFSIFSDSIFDTEISAIFYALDQCFHDQTIVYAGGYESKSCLRTGMTGPSIVEDGALMITADYKLKIRGV